MMFIAWFIYSAYAYLILVEPLQNWTIIIVVSTTTVTATIFLVVFWVAYLLLPTAENLIYSCYTSLIWQEKRTDSYLIFTLSKKCIVFIVTKEGRGFEHGRVGCAFLEPLRYPVNKGQILQHTGQVMAPTGKQREGDSWRQTGSTLAAAIDVSFLCLAGMQQEPRSKTEGKMSAEAETAHPVTISSQHRRNAVCQVSRQKRSLSPTSPYRMSQRFHSYSQSSLISQEGKGLESCVKALATKKDFGVYIQQTKATYKKEMTELKRDIGARMDKHGTGHLWPGRWCLKQQLLQKYPMMLYTVRP